MKPLFLLIVLFSLSLAKNHVYKGTTVYKLTLRSEKQQETINLLQNGFIDFWRKPSYKHNTTGLAMVPQMYKQWFEQIVEELDIATDKHIDDVYEYLTQKYNNQNTLDIPTRLFDFDDFYRYNEILEHLNNIQANNADKVQVVEIGRTEEDRPLIYVKVSSNLGTSNPVVLIEGGINPREWITVPAAVNIITRLLTEDELLEGLDWIILPVVNPDGYEHTHTEDRLWTKSRSTNSDLGFICPGVNINRNFDIDWQNWEASSSPCSHLYTGREPFSEIETQLVTNLINSNNVVLYISLQNTRGFVSYPWYYERAASGMFIQHYRIASAMLSALNNGNYYVDSSAIAAGDRISGTSTDFVFTSGVLLSFNLDIMPDDNSGVLIDESEILGIVNSVWNAVAAAARFIL